jgi:hypothetical protein
MAEQNEAAHKTAFTISIEARTGVSTGISAFDRAHTIATAINPDCTSADIVSPGHVFPAGQYTIAAHPNLAHRARRCVCTTIGVDNPHLDSATRSIGAKHCRDLSPTDAWRSTTTLPRTRCAALPWAGRIVCSPVPIPAEKEPPASTPLCAPRSSTTSTPKPTYATF